MCELLGREHLTGQGKWQKIKAAVQSQRPDVGSRIAIPAHTRGHFYPHGASDGSKSCCNWILLPFLLLGMDLIGILVFLIIMEKSSFFSPLCYLCEHDVHVKIEFKTLLSGACLS